MQSIVWGIRCTAALRTNIILDKNVSQNNYHSQNNHHHKIIHPHNFGFDLIVIQTMESCTCSVNYKLFP